MPAPFLDAHQHLQDVRLRPYLDLVTKSLRQHGVARWVVAGTSEADWPEVARLAAAFPEAMPCYGLHPWLVGEKSRNWEERLASFLERPGVAAVGEIGLDKWVRGHDSAVQEPVFRRQLQMANAAGLPAVIHCLKAWGRLLELLHLERPERGFLLHSYGGPVELVAEFAALGGYFSFSGYFLHPRKAATLETFCRAVPRERLLIETDAPDMRLPEELESYALATESGGAINHPANLPAIYEGLADALGMEVGDLAERVAENFTRFFFAKAPAGGCQGKGII